MEELKQKEQEALDLNLQIELQKKTNQKLLEENEYIRNTIDDYKDRTKQLLEEKKTKNVSNWN